MRPPELAMIRDRSQTAVQRVKAAGYDVVGDLDDLTSSAPDLEARHPDEVTERELLQLALPLLAELLGRARAEYVRAEEAERKTAASEPIAQRPQLLARWPRRRGNGQREPGA